MDGEVAASAHTVVSSEILDEQDFPVTMPDSDSQLLCEVDNTNQRSSRRLVLCGARGPTQESLAEVPTAHDSVEMTPQDGEVVTALGQTAFGQYRFRPVPL